VLTDWGNAFAGNGLIEAGHGYCFGMRDHFAILYSGDVVLCCVDFDGRTSIGNLKDSSLLEILRGPELERIMKGFRLGRLVHRTVVDAWEAAAVSDHGSSPLPPSWD